MRIGVFGGTFDPVHLGHLVLAEQCREQACLDQVWYMPAWRPPHKQDRPLSRYEARVEMLELALAGNPHFQVSQLERERTGVSYTVETLAELNQRYPSDQFWLILGSDCLPDLPGWYQPVRIAELATLLVVARPGWSMLGEKDLRIKLGLAPEQPLRLEAVSAPLVDISSSDLRRRVQEGKSIRYQVPRAVECYIETHGLYRLPC